MFVLLNVNMKVFLLIVTTGFFILHDCVAQEKMPVPIQMFNGKDLKDWTIKIKDHALNENFGNTFRVENGLMKVSYDQYDSFKQQFGHIFYKKKLYVKILNL